MQVIRIAVLERNYDLLKNVERVAQLRRADPKTEAFEQKDRGYRYV
jgi:hypothetical protein